MKNIIEKIKKSWLIKRTTTLVFMAGLVAIFIAITLWINSLDLDPIDLTDEKLYTLTNVSKEKVKNIENEVNIYFIGYNENDNIIDLVKQYKNVNNKINIENITAIDRPDLVQKYGINESSRGVLVESNEKVKLLTDDDFYTYDTESYDQIDITEEKITNAILYVVAEKIPTVYFLTGYSTFSTTNNMSLLTVYMQNDITEFKELSVLSEGKVPEDCDTLVITTPERDFDDITTNAILDYINKGGNILWFNAVLTQKQDLTNVNKILAQYGVNPFEVGVIFETDASKMVQGSPQIIMPTINKSTITKNITNALVVNANKINFESFEKLKELNVEKTVLMQTGDKAFYRKNFTIDSASKQKDEEEGSFVLGAELDKTIEKRENDSQNIVSKLVIYAENIFVSDLTLSSTSGTPMIMYAQNREVAIDSIAYLVDRYQDIIIRKDTNKTPYTATVEQNNIIQLIIFGIPILIIIIGIIVWQIRRRKK